MENKSAFAIVQIGVGVICLSIGIGIFLQFWVNYFLGATFLLLGTGTLLHGVTNIAPTNPTEEFCFHA